MSGLSDVLPKSKSKPSKAGKLKGNAGSNGRKNPKAFSVANVVRTKRTMQRNLDRSQKKEVIPLTSREEELPPPALVVVMGPKGCGKSTLIRSLVKIYSGQNMADTVGPITVVAGRKRRITLFECPLDLYSMTDLAKVADLVLVMVDASYGFEMETFEYLNLLQLHGFPKVMGIMTNLDKFKANKTLQNAKKAIKHRFWTEIYKGAKMFEFMGVINGKYRKHEVKRLSLYVSRVKFRPLIWRNTHPYVVVDRVEDVTPISRSNGNGNGKGHNALTDGTASATDREVTLYGYVRGSHLKPTMKMHLIGAGDFEISAISSLPDPCPLPHNSGGGANAVAGGKVASTLRSRKDSLLYAPMANVGRVTMDRDGLYIELKSINYTKKSQLYLADQQQTGLGKQMVSADGDGTGTAGYKSRTAAQMKDGLTPVEILRSMQDVKVGVDQQLRRERGDRANQSLSLFAGGEETSYNGEEDGYSDEEEDEEEGEEGGGDTSDEEEGSEMEEGDDYDNEFDDQYESDGEEGSEEGSDDGDSDGSDSEGSEGSGLDSETEEDARRGKRNADPAAMAQFGRTGLVGTGAGAGAGVGSGGGLEGGVVRGADRMATGGADLMRAVYGNNWAGGITKGPSSAGEDALVDEAAEESDDELFVLPGQGAAGKVSGQQQRKAAQQAQYLLDNAVDSSRVWTGVSGELSGLAFGEHQGSINTHTGTLNEHATLLDHLRYLEKTGTADGKSSAKDAKSSATSASALPHLTQHVSTSKLPAESSETWWQMMKARCVTGGYANKITADGLAGVGENAGDGSDDEGFGEFEDLQTGEKFGGKASKGHTSGEGSDSEDSDAGETERRNLAIDAELRQLNAAKKANFKATFDKRYDEKELHDDDDEDGAGGGKAKRNKRRKGKGDDSDSEDSDAEDKTSEEYLTAAKKLVEEQRERNKHEFADEGEFARQQHEGFRQGLYVRILLKKVPQEFTQNFRAQIPVILGGLLPHELNMGFITARVKRHRWHKRVLKSNDPLIFSIGWRRYQSIPIYTTVDQNERERYLKYTPEHMHCTATFYGPLVPPNTGILGYQKADSTTAGFRIALTGTALEQRATPQVTKKLKLVGHPTKIYKNSAFITGMFNSAMEVAKFEHAKLKTVSGIRGSVKKALRESNHIASDGGMGSAAAKQAPGTFRATFEDKIVMSDIVICRMWVPVEVKQFYNPVLSLLAEYAHPGAAAASAVSDRVEELSEGEGDDQSEGEDKPKTLKSVTGNTAAVPKVPLMRTTAELRREKQIPLVVNKDSVYKPIVRQAREFAKLKVPAKLQEALPFATKPKQQAPKNRDSYLAKRAVILEPEEKKARAVVQMLSTVRKSKLEKRHASTQERFTKKRKAKELEASRFEDQVKETKRAKYRDEGKKKAHRPSKGKK